MTLVFPLIKSTCDCIELKYALRSIAFLNPARVIIIGYKPKWVKNVEHYPYANRPGIWFKEENIYNKIRFAFTLTDEFLFCNDDHFINPGFDPYKFYSSGLIADLLPKASNGYKKTILNTIKHFEHDVPNYDVHCPIYMHKGIFENSFRNVVFPKHGLMIKSIYAHSLPRCEYPDMKISTLFNPGELQRRLYFSVSDKGLTNYFKFNLEKMYPVKSKFEK